MMSRRLAVGLVGHGRWGQHILRDLLSLGCEVVVADPLESARNQALTRGASSAVETAELLPAVSGVVVATPTQVHVHSIERLLNRGIPIFCEKPLAADPVTAKYLASLAPTRLFVMDKWRYHPGIELLGEIARSGEMGEVEGLTTERLGWLHGSTDIDGVWLLAPHDLSIALEILGVLPEPVSAVAEYRNGAMTGLRGRLGIKPWMNLNVSVLGSDFRRAITLHCVKGSVSLPDPYSPHIHITYKSKMARRQTNPIELRSISTEWPLLREIKTFLVHLDGGPTPRSSAAEGAEIVAVLARLRDLAEGCHSVQSESLPTAIQP